MRSRFMGAELCLGNGFCCISIGIGLTVWKGFAYPSVNKGRINVQLQSGTLEGEAGAAESAVQSLFELGRNQ